MHLDAISDNGLMLKVKAGDVDKLGLLFERYNKALFGFFYRMTQNAKTSEDLVQNVFLRILKYKHTFTGEGKFTTWMYHLARNISIDHHKKQNKMGYKDELSQWENQLPEEVSTEDKLHQQEDIRMLNVALGRLSPDKREVLVLSRYQGLKYKEIATLMNCSEGAVKVRIHRALSDLKDIYQKLEKNQQL